MDGRCGRRGCLLPPDCACECVLFVQDEILRVLIAWLVKVERWGSAHESVNRNAAQQHWYWHWPMNDHLQVPVYNPIGFFFSAESGQFVTCKQTSVPSPRPMAITFRDVGIFALCILFPPVAVWLIKGRCDTDLVREVLGTMRAVLCGLRCYLC